MNVRCSGTKMIDEGTDDGLQKRKETENKLARKRAKRFQKLGRVKKLAEQLQLFKGGKG